MLFTIQSIKLFFMHYFRSQNWKFKHLVDDIAINCLSSLNFASMGYIIRTCNQTIRFSKFISNKKI